MTKESSSVCYVCDSKGFNLNPFAIHPNDYFCSAKFLIIGEQVEFGFATGESMPAEADVTPLSVEVAFNQFGLSESILEDNFVAWIWRALFKIITNSNNLFALEDRG